MRSTKTFAALTTLLLLTSCAGPATTECGWVRSITVADGDTITRPTAEQIVAHNRKVERFCR